MGDDPLKQEILGFGEPPVNMKPSKIFDHHNKLCRILNITRDSDQIVQYSGSIEERYRKEAKDTEYTDGVYSILMPKDAMEIIQEGRVLQHCVGRAGYIRKMANNRCTILFLRKNEDLDTPLITMEVIGNTIFQCHGFRDSYNHDPEIGKFIQRYAELHGLEIRTMIGAE